MDNRKLFEVSLIGGMHNTFNVLAESYSLIEEYFGQDDIFQITKCVDFSYQRWAVNLYDNGRLIKIEKKNKE